MPQKSTGSCGDLRRLILFQSFFSFGGMGILVPPCLEGLDDGFQGLSQIRQPVFDMRGDDREHGPGNERGGPHFSDRAISYYLA